MVEISNMQIPPPRNWQDFETLCWDLWKTIFNDPETQKNGRQGQKQNGVDIYGRPNVGNEWTGIQCKGKDNFSEKTITEKELGEEVEKAKSFEPNLSTYILATTGQRDQEVQKLARKITDEHRQKELFSVNVFFWDDIQERLMEHQEILRRHYKDLFPEKPSEFNEIEDDVHSITNPMSSLKSNIEDKVLISIPDFSKEVLNNEYQAELVQIRELIIEKNPSSALKALENLKNRIWLNAAPSVRYRILINQGAAYLNLHKYFDAGRLFVEALQYNSEDEKANENAAFGYLLLDDLPTAKKMALAILKNNPISSRAHSIILQATSSGNETDRLISNIPDHIKKTQDVAYVIGNIAHNKGNLHESKKWLEIAIENEIEDTSHIKALLSSVLLELVSTDPITFGGCQLNEHQINLLNKSVELCTFAWEKMLDPDLQKLHVLVLVTRGIAKKLLGDSDGCENDIKTAFNLVPQHPKVIYFKALSDLESGKPEKAVNSFKEILLENETPEALFLYFEALKRLGKSNDAIVEINSLLKQDFAPEKVVETIGNAEIVFTNKTPISKSVLEQVPSVKYIGVLATGYNVVDTVAAKEIGIKVTNIPTYGTTAVAQYTIALLLEMCHHVGDHGDAVKKGDWTKSPDFCFWNYPLIELAGKTLGLIGFGRIGQATAKIAQAFGLDVLAYDINENPELEGEICKYVTLDELLASSDIISLHCPLHESNMGINEIRSPFTFN